MLITISTDSIVQKIKEQGTDIPQPLMDKLIATFNETAEEDTQEFINFLETEAANQTIETYKTRIVPLSELLNILGGQN